MALAGAGLWLWLDDSRVLLWTLTGLAGCIALFALLAGWLLFSSGVDSEHAQGLEEYNRLQEHEWQRWAQQSVQVSGWHTIFSPQVLTPEQASDPVNSDIPLTLPPFPGYGWLAEEVIMALLPELKAVIHRWPLEVLLPEDAGDAQWRQFVASWQQCGLLSTRLTAPAASVSTYDITLHHWLDEPVNDRARLVIVKHWTGTGEHTEGVVALLVIPQAGEDDIPVRCSLHRPLSVAPGDESAAFLQFLHYQRLTTRMSGLWTDHKSAQLADRLVIAHSQRLKNDAPCQPERDQADAPASLPNRYCLPHWLGHAGPCADWFAVTLMMAMAEYSDGVQCGFFSSDSPSASWILNSVSAGAFVND
ncbi:hypothetical protein ACQK5W_14210 [Pantoea sp. FN060301]|uniref:hypothetical protein n=1 Tax=Pantoea sp. FN060301 TaxID=3420380 RepID=UPI003D16BBDE